MKYCQRIRTPHKRMKRKSRREKKNSTWKPNDDGQDIDILLQTTYWGQINNYTVCVPKHRKRCETKFNEIKKKK